jgi:hypothetical protein
MEPMHSTKYLVSQLEDIQKLIEAVPNRISNSELLDHSKSSGEYGYDSTILESLIFKQDDELVNALKKMILDLLAKMIAEAKEDMAKTLPSEHFLKSNREATNELTDDELLKRAKAIIDGNFFLNNLRSHIVGIMYREFGNRIGSHYSWEKIMEIKIDEFGNQIVS